MTDEWQHDQSVKKYEEKKEYEKTLPRILNYINYNSKDLKANKISLSSLKVTCYDIVDSKDNKKYQTVVSKIEGEIHLEKITEIICPVCGGKAKLNTFWNCFICNDKTHERKIYDIVEVKLVVEGEKVVGDKNE